ncbi:hypothetical protein VP01_2301g3 [Puccinia sorghi]|uniref:Uncharacterized protein n=1 Tax=Puccinia sorghi TaxID=27349 RepID=A0A0L6V9S8_9BASI|nr:hypothetical protein VP01_2301g3 [Puccinia sorghi]
MLKIYKKNMLFFSFLSIFFPSLIILKAINHSMLHTLFGHHQYISRTTTIIYIANSLKNSVKPTHFTKTHTTHTTYNNHPIHSITLECWSMQAKLSLLVDFPDLSLFVAVHSASDTRSELFYFVCTGPFHGFSRTEKNNSFWLKSLNSVQAGQPKSSTLTMKCMEWKEILRDSKCGVCTPYNTFPQAQHNHKQDLNKKKEKDIQEKNELIMFSFGQKQCFSHIELLVQLQIKGCFKSTRYSTKHLLIHFDARNSNNESSTFKLHNLLSQLSSSLTQPQFFELVCFEAHSLLAFNFKYYFSCDSTLPSVSVSSSSLYTPFAYISFCTFLILFSFFLIKLSLTSLELVIFETDMSDLSPHLRTSPCALCPAKSLSSTLGWSHDNVEAKKNRKEERLKQNKNKRERKTHQEPFFERLGVELNNEVIRCECYMRLRNKCLIITFKTLLGPFRHSSKIF